MAYASSSATYVPDRLRPWKYQHFSIVFFDIQKTGLRWPQREVIQIAAKENQQKYNDYVKPFGSIPDEVTHMNGLVWQDGVMYFKGKSVHSVPKNDAVVNFLRFLYSIDNQVILVAHNCFKFDAFVLIDLVNDVGMMQNFRHKVAGFSDSLPFFKEYLRNEEGYKLPELARRLLRYPEGPYDAVDRVEIMQMLLFHKRINADANYFVENYQSVDNFSNLHYNQ